MKMRHLLPKIKNIFILALFNCILVPLVLRYWTCSVTYVDTQERFQSDRIHDVRLTKTLELQQLSRRYDHFRFFENEINQLCILIREYGDDCLVAQVTRLI